MKKSEKNTQEAQVFSREFINWYNDPQRLLTCQFTEQPLNANYAKQNSEISKDTNTEKTEKQSIGSGLETDVEDNVSDVETIGEGRFDPTIDDNLPPTVTLLTTPDGGKLYLVGTAHFSVESQNDVSKMIRAVQPHIVMVELCKHRIQVLQSDEETLIRESQNIGFDDIRAAVKRHGLTSGLMFIVLLSMSRQVTKELGMAPGSEFRRAFVEAGQIPNCIIHLGDRPFNITMQRAFQSLSFWQKVKCVWKILSSNESITKEEVEKCKNRETLDALMDEITSEFPPLAEVFVKERDLFLTYSLQLTCQPHLTNEGVIVPTRAVGVVGMGHMPGIIRNWGKVHALEIQSIMKIPPQALSSKIIGFTVKASFISAVIYVGYKTIPMPSTQTLQTITSSVGILLKRFSTHFGSSVDIQSR